MFAVLAFAVASAAAPAGTSQLPDSLATVRVRVTSDGVPVPSATVRAGSVGALSDASGMALLALRPGSHVVIAGRLGFASDSLRLMVRAGLDTTVHIGLRRAAAEVERMVVSSTRAERLIEDTPLRVEVVDEEEVAEKTLMTPGDVTMMMNETSGLRVAATSPSLGGANVRIQGLRGRYTLVLTDGLPLAGAQGSFGLLQIPPVDLARMEVIKGSASALYGPAALGGVINLLSRRPTDSARHELLLNHTSRGGRDAAYYGSAPAGHSPVAASLLASVHQQDAADVDRDGWADQAGYARQVARPRLFYDAPGRSLLATAGYTAERRNGGTMAGALAPDGAAHPEELDTRRSDAGLVGRITVLQRNVLSMRLSAARQRHDHVHGATTEQDRHDTRFAEATLALPGGSGIATLVAGAAYEVNGYRHASLPAFDFDHRVASAFGQLDVDAAHWLALSASLRGDDHNRYGASVSPRVSALLRRGEYSARFSLGTGTFAPTPLTEETEAVGLARVVPPAGLRAERALTMSVDLSGEVGPVLLNATAHGSRLRHALAVVDTAALELVSSPVDSRTRGVEGLARWRVTDALRVTAAYAWLRATEWQPGSQPAARRAVPLAPRHSASLDVNHESERTRVGVELYYTGRQSLDDNPYLTESVPYVMYGLLAERRLEAAGAELRLFVNAENLGGVRMSRWQPLVRPTRGAGGRWTTDAWTDLAGTLVNGGVRLAF
jgi:outer membrane receptor for ferrienterochelin and colicins